MTESLSYFKNGPVHNRTLAPTPPTAPLEFHDKTTTPSPVEGQVNPPAASSNTSSIPELVSGKHTRLKERAIRQREIQYNTQNLHAAPADLPTVSSVKELKQIYVALLDNHWLRLGIERNSNYDSILEQACEISEGYIDGDGLNRRELWAMVRATIHDEKQ